VSGFAGIIRIEPNADSIEKDRLAIELMARAIAFRGPDALQLTSTATGSFAFSLLKTGPAPQEPSQPCTLHGETWFLGDVRCDGREELKQKLLQHGVELPASPSSEHLVLQYFGKFGEAGLPDLNGDLSFILWHARARKLVGYRDLTGARPFFYSQQNGTLVFSNTLQAVLSHSSVSRELDDGFTADFLLGYPYYDPSVSAYRDIRRLPPGHVLEFSENGLSVRRIANMPIEDLLILKRDEEYIEEFQRLFTQSVRDQLPPIDTSILLSGGLDSTTLAARAVSLRKQDSPGSDLKLHALSVDSKPVVDDEEADLACHFAASLGIPCQVVHYGDVLPFGSLDDTPVPLPEPALDPYTDLCLFYQRLVAKHSSVVLSGSGGDEVLRLQAMPYLRFLYKRGGPLPAISTLGRYVISQRKLPPLGAGIRSGFLRILGRKSLQPSFPPWFVSDFQRRMNLHDRWQSMNGSVPSKHPFNPRAYSSLNDLWVASLLEFFDATWTGCALEPRNPFLDRRLSRFLVRVPLIPWSMDKYLLRRSQAGILPDEIRFRPKTPVTRDLVLLHAASGRWDPAAMDPATGSLGGVVDWKLLCNYLRGNTESSLYIHLRPVALSRWLKSTNSR
jgi:asparagine synthase (glutamine-hydrolysing)